MTSSCPLFSICSQVWGLAHLSDILPPCILSGVRLGKSHHENPFLLRRRCVEARA
jgi:hypothetical protein